MRVNRMTSVERRAAPRVDARLPLQLTEPDSRLVVTTESIDLSRGGIGCRTSEYLAPLSKVAVTIILPPFGTLSRASRSLRAEGVVVRCELTSAAGDEAPADPEYDLACCFTALEPDAKNLLDAFVAWRLLRSVRVTEERTAHLRAPGRLAGGARPGPHSRQGGPSRTGSHPRASTSPGAERGRRRYPGAKDGATASSDRGRRSGAPADRRGSSRGERGYGSGAGTGPSTGGPRQPGQGPRKGPRRNSPRGAEPQRGGRRDRDRPSFRRPEEPRVPETAGVAPAGREREGSEERRDRWGRRPTRKAPVPPVDRGPSPGGGQDG
jgi:hypothetical protein